MKKKKILNIRNSLITGSLILTTLLTGCGLLKGDRSNQSQNGNSSSSQTIIDDNHDNTNELPGGIVDNPVTPTPGEKDQTTKDPVINSEEQEQKPGTVTPSNPTDGNTDTGVTPVEPTNPTITTPETEHKHALGEWVAIDDLFEGSYCPEDGTLMLTRTHDYKVTDIKIIDTLDGFSHDTTITETCTTCGHEKSTTYSREGHTYGEITWDETNEYETCKDCGHVHTIGKHKFDNGKVQGNEKIYSCENEGCGYTYSKPYTPGHTTGGGSHGGGGSSTDRPSHTHNYGAWVSFNDELEVATCSCGDKKYQSHNYDMPSTKVVSNFDGTHTITTATTCKNCGHSKTNTTTETCDYKTTNTYTATDDKHHTHTITDVCEDCSHSKTVSSKEETCNFTLTNSVTEANGDVTETYTCDNNCGNTYTKKIPYTPGSHTHSWGAWTYLDENNEQRVCLTDSSHKETRGHSYGSTFGKEDGEYQNCSTCNHDKKVGDHTWEWAYLDESTEKKVCKNNCGITSNETQGHHYDYSNGVVNDEQTKITYTCTSCGHSKDAAYSPVHNTHTWGPWDGNSRKCTGCDVVDTHTPSTGTCTGNKEEITCPTCGDKYTITKEHNYEDKYNSSGEYQECSNCHNKTTTTPHSFTYNSSTGRLECACGYSESHSHASTGEICSANVVESGHCNLCNQDYKIYGPHLYNAYVEEDGDTRIEHCKCGKTREVTIANAPTNPTTAEEIKDGNDLTTEEVVIPVAPDNAGTKGEGSSNASATETPGNETTITDPEVTLPKENLGNEAEGENKEDSEKEDEFTPEVAPETPVTPGVSEPKEDVTEAMDAGKDEAQAVIEAGNKEVEQAIDAGSKEVDEIMERSTAELQARMEQADAELAAILANSPLQRIRRLF